MRSADILIAAKDLAEPVRSPRTGDKIVGTDHDRRVARIISTDPRGAGSGFGSARGEIQMRDDFDEPLGDFAPCSE